MKLTIHIYWLKSEDKAIAFYIIMICLKIHKDGQPTKGIKRQPQDRSPQIPVAKKTRTAFGDITNVSVLMYHRFNWFKVKKQIFSCWELF